MPKPKSQPKRPAKAATKAAKLVVTNVTPKKELTDAERRERFFLENPTWQDRFLALFGQSLNISRSALGAGVDRQTVYREKAKDPEFAAAMQEAKNEAIERLEAAAFERAQNMSDVLLIFLLKSHKPEIYRESFDQRHSGQVEVIVRREQRTGTTKTD